MNLKRLLAGTGLILGTVLVLGLLYLTFADFSRFKPQIEALVSESLDREFRIDGDFSIEIFPVVSVSIDNASLANATWGAEPNMLEVGHLSARVSAWSLLSRPILIQDLRAQDIRVMLERSAAGAGNWELGQEPSADTAAEPEAATAGRFASPIELQIAQVDNVSIEYRAPETATAGVTLATFSVNTGEDGRHAISGAGEVFAWPFSFEGAAGGRRVDIDATLGDVAILASASYPNESFEVSLDVGTLDKLGELLDIDRLPAEQLTLRGRVGFDGGRILLSDLLASVGAAEVAVDGELGDGVAQLAVDLRVPSLRAFEATMPELPFTMVTELSADAAGLTIDPFDVTFGDSDLAGSMKTSGGDAPNVTLQATSRLLDLTPFESSTDSAEQPDDAPTSQYVFTEAPLPLEQLSRLDADVDLTVERLVTSLFEIEELEADVNAGNGQIDIQSEFRDVSGGSFNNQIALRVADAGVELDLKTGIQDLRLGVFSGPEIPIEQVPPSNLDLDVTAFGDSARALAASSNGTVLFTQGPGRVKNELIEKLSGDVIAQLFDALNPFAAQQEYTQWECSVLAVDLVDGVGRISGMLLQSQKLTVVGRGQIDLTTEALDIEFNTKPRSGIGVSADMFVTPFVKLSGTLAKPGIGANATGLLLSGGAAVLTGGMSFLYQGLLDRATAQADQCARVLARVGAAAEPDAEAELDAPGDQER